MDVYDWDYVIVEANVSNLLSARLDLCSVGQLPCRLQIRGQEGAQIQRQGEGSIACLASSTGCYQLSISNVQFSCDGSISRSSVVEAEGSEVRVEHSSFTGCSSQFDGGVIRSYSKAQVAVLDSTFSHSTSSVSGGAISAVGSSLVVSNSRFVNCTALSAGGAISGVQLEAYLKERTITEIDIQACVFVGCSSSGMGGAVSAQRGSLVSILSSDFRNCKAGTVGGAISARTDSFTQILNSSFDLNTALGSGGGGLHLSHAHMLLVGLTGQNNSAPHGGGGLLMWEGAIPPVVLAWCLPGQYADTSIECSNIDCTLCINCEHGTFSTGVGETSPLSCKSCNPGSYSSALGSSQCELCTAGSFSSAEGANSSNTCAMCANGTHSGEGADKCTPEAPGLSTESSQSDLRDSSTVVGELADDSGQSIRGEQNGTKAQASALPSLR